MRSWAAIHTALRAAKVKSVAVESAAATVATRRGASPLDALLGGPPVLLDVREPRFFAAARPDGADNVPLYTQLARLRVACAGVMRLRVL
jgi:hypothetical protein